VSDQVAHPYKTTGKVIVLYTLIFKLLDSKLEVKTFCTEWQGDAAIGSTNRPASERSRAWKQLARSSWNTVRYYQEVELERKPGECGYHRSKWLYVHSPIYVIPDIRNFKEILKNQIRNIF
jgi:hypothetical protein